MTGIASRLITTATVALLCATGCDSEGRDTIGPRGGMVTSPDGRLTLDIPAGALDHEVVVTIGEIDGPHDAVGPTYEILPRGTVFQFPAEIIYDLSGEDMTGADMGRLHLVTEKADGWDRMADHDLDMEAGVATASAMFLSAYTVVEQ